MFLNSNFEIYKYIIFQVIAMARKRRRATTRRRTSRRAIKKRASRSITSNWKKISTAAGVLAGVQQLTNKDMTHTAGMPIAT